MYGFFLFQRVKVNNLLIPQVDKNVFRETANKRTVVLLWTTVVQGPLLWMG